MPELLPAGVSNSLQFFLSQGLVSFFPKLGKRIPTIFYPPGSSQALSRDPPVPFPHVTLGHETKSVRGISAPGSCFSDSFLLPGQNFSVLWAPRVSTPHSFQGKGLAGHGLATKHITLWTLGSRPGLACACSSQSSAQGGAMSKEPASVPASPRNLTDVHSFHRQS